ncbi:MAG: hypothetical protein K8J31_30730, partial [Anaerolineae bacterium]|nr:hypothetical protein [Anaerolineae bacterium]
SMQQATPLPPCGLADLDHSGEVDIFDVRLLTHAYGSRASDPLYIARYDLDESGEIDILDLRRLTAQYGKTCPRGD